MDLEQTANQPGQPVQCLTYSVKQAAGVLGISDKRLYLSIESGDIPALKFGRAVRIPRIAIERMVAEVAAK